MERCRENNVKISISTLDCYSNILLTLYFLRGHCKSGGVWECVCWPIVRVSVYVYPVHFIDQNLMNKTILTNGKACQGSTCRIIDNYSGRTCKNQLGCKTVWLTKMGQWPTSLYNDMEFGQILLVIWKYDGPLTKIDGLITNSKMEP